VELWAREMSSNFA